MDEDLVRHAWVVYADWRSWLSRQPAGGSLRSLVGLRFRVARPLSPRGGAPDSFDGVIEEASDGPDGEVWRVSGSETSQGRTAEMEATLREPGSYYPLSAAEVAVPTVLADSLRRDDDDRSGGDPADIASAAIAAARTAAAVAAVEVRLAAAGDAGVAGGGQDAVADWSAARLGCDASGWDLAAAASALRRSASKSEKNR